jgi:hypothetical protein
MGFSLMLRSARKEYGPTMGIKLPPDCVAYGNENPYFFAVAPNRITARNSGHYRHMKIHKDEFFDYINKTSYESFHDWLASIPGDPEIRFGFQRWDGRDSSVSMGYIQSILEPEQRVEIPMPAVARQPLQLPNDHEEVDDELKELMNMMRDHGIGVEDVKIRDFVPAKMWMESHNE